MSTIRRSTPMRGMHFLALFNAGYLHINNCTILAQFSTKMSWIRPMPVLKFERVATISLGLNGQQLRCFYQQQGSDEQLIAEFHNATTKSVPTMQEVNYDEAKTTTADGYTNNVLQSQSRNFHSPNGKFRLSTKYQKGKIGQKFVGISKYAGSINENFVNILVPEDIFGFVQAMDELLSVLQAKKGENGAATNSLSHTVHAKGQNYDYQLKLIVHNRFVDVHMQSVPNAAWPGHKPRRLILPLPAFHWLRHTIGELFAANGEEHIQLQLGEPPALPENVLMNNAEVVDGYQILARRIVPLDRNGQRLHVIYEMGQSGRMYFRLVKTLGSSDSLIYRFVKINVPEDVFAFVQAMDHLLNAVHANRDIIEVHVKLRRTSNFVLHTVKAAGTNYDFELVLYINKSGQVEVALRSVPNQAAPEHNSSYHFGISIGCGVPLRKWWRRMACGLAERPIILSG